MSRPKTYSLTHQLIDNHLAIGLACVFAGTIIAIHMALWEAISQLIAVAVAVPLVLLLIGAAVLRRSTRVPGTIDEQLRQLTQQSITEGKVAIRRVLQPVKEAGPVASGWNYLLRRLTDQEGGESLQTRLSEVFGAASGGRWEAAFQCLPDGIAITDETGRIEAANPAFLATLRLPNDRELANQSIHDLLAAWSHDEDNPILDQLQKSTFKLTGDLRRTKETLDGVLRVSRQPLIGSVATSAVGEGQVWTLRDVTQARLSDEMRNQFVFTATHELRTPLANIKAYAETLAIDGDIDVERQKGFYNIINAEATRLARFIDELLDVSQMETGAINVVRHETDIERLLHDVMETVQPQIKQKHLLFESRFPAKLPKMLVDKDKLGAALINLLGNAVKYTPEGGEVRMIVEVEQRQLDVHVEDNGIGIRPEELDRLGEKFFRSEDERVRNIPGSGLGLAFATEVARLHRGSLSITSELNQGSRFTLSLPAETEDA